MRCPKDDMLMVIDNGPLAFDDYRCIECGHQIRLEHQDVYRKGSSAPKIELTVQDICITQVSGPGKGRRYGIPRKERVARGLCQDCCQPLDRAPSPRCKKCRARVCASVRKVYLKNHPGARSFKNTVNA